MAVRAGHVIAIVDDDEDVREALRGLMRALGFPTVAFSSATEFLQSSEVGRTACLIADVNLPGMSGVELCHRLAQLGNLTPTILITAYPTDNLRSLARAAGVLSFLVKPFVEADLVEAVRVALDQDPS
jgi:FixJ family two-component response regulator